MTVAMISSMDGSEKKRSRFWIYYPETRIMIASDRVLTDQNMETDDFTGE